MVKGIFRLLKTLYRQLVYFAQIFLAKLGLVCVCQCRVYLTMNFNILKTLNFASTTEFGLYILSCP